MFCIICFIVADCILFCVLSCFVSLRFMCYSICVPKFEFGIWSFTFSENLDIHFVMLSMSVGSDDVDVDCVIRFQFEVTLEWY